MKCLISEIVALLGASQTRFRPPGKIMLNLINFTGASVSLLSVSDFSLKVTFSVEIELKELILLSVDSLIGLTLEVDSERLKESLVDSEGKLLQLIDSISEGSLLLVDSEIMLLQLVDSK